MEVILGKGVSSFTGSLNKAHGYAVQKRGNRFYGVRNTRGVVPPDGHLKFILGCAEIAQLRMYIADIKVQPGELRAALEEAHCFVAAGHVHDRMVYDARDIRNFKTTFGL